MGITSIIGMVLSLAVIVVANMITGGNTMDLLDPASFIMTFIPAVLCLIATFPMEIITAIPAHFKVLLGKGYQVEDYLADIISMAKRSRAEGLLALQDVNSKEPFLNYGVRMIVDGLQDESVRNSLDENLESLNKRHSEAIGLYEKGAAYAPAFGMIGTVVGLVNMLMGLDFSDPSAINMLGANMALALITTLYGSMLANILFMPIAGRLKLLHKREMHCKAIIGNCILAIQRGDSPSVIEDGLIQQLDQKSQKKFGGGAAASE